MHTDKLMSISLSVGGELRGGPIRLYVFPYQFTAECVFPCQFTQKH
jgi:hypothetical protein